MKRKSVYHICIIIFIICVIGLVGYIISYTRQSMKTRDIQKGLQSMKEVEEFTPYSMQYDEYGFPVAGVAAVLSDRERTDYVEETEEVEQLKPEVSQPEKMQKYQSLYDTNSSMAGWLAIEGTNIDYPVMQTMADEDYYLSVDFYGEPNKNGCLVLDTDSVVGTGTRSFEYADGTAPSTNLIIHGHTMKSGDMFGNLKLYADEAYGKEHNLICFDSLYEERAYELIAVFYSQVFYENEDVFKYYNFFQADTQEEFDNWYTNIKESSLYDTGVTAEFGDEFITLSCCAYHTEDGRFVVVGRRICSVAEDT